MNKKHLEAVSTNVSNLLRKERENRKLSMTTVAERAGLSQQMISFVERGMRNPTLDTLLRISAALDINFVTVLDRAQKQAG